MLTLIKAEISIFKTLESDRFGSFLKNLENLDFLPTKLENFVGIRKLRYCILHKHTKYQNTGINYKHKHFRGRSP